MEKPQDTVREGVSVDEAVAEPSGKSRPEVAES